MTDAPPAAGSIVAARVREAKDGNHGFNAASEKYEDLVAVGVIDPTKVVRSALQNAGSIAGLLPVAVLGWDSYGLRRSDR